MQEIIIIIPCYNESQRLDREIFGNFLNNNPTIQLFFVDDGSTDNTYSVLRDLSESHTNAISFKLEKNSGKAEAIRQSVIEITQKYNCQYFGYFDADLSTSLEYINVFYKKMLENENIKIVTGARICRLGATIKRNPIRHYPGRIVATIASMILSLPFYDTQCGAKLFNKNFVTKIFEEPFKTKWLFDIEIFKRLNNLYNKDIMLQSIYEYPLAEWIDDGNSRIKLKDFIRVPLDLFKIAKTNNNAK